MIIDKTQMIRSGILRRKLMEKDLDGMLQEISRIDNMGNFIRESKITDYELKANGIYYYNDNGDTMLIVRSDIVKSTDNITTN